MRESWLFCFVFNNSTKFPFMALYHSWMSQQVYAHDLLPVILKLLPSKPKVQHRIPDSPNLPSGSVTAVHPTAWTCRSSPSSGFPGVRRCPQGTYCTLVCRELLISSGWLSKRELSSIPTQMLDFWRESKLVSVSLQALQNCSGHYVPTET